VNISMFSSGSFINDKLSQKNWLLDGGAIRNLKIFPRKSESLLFIALTEIT